MIRYYYDSPNYGRSHSYYRRHYRRRNPDDLLFADTAEEALLPREELLRRQHARRKGAIKRRAIERPRPVERAAPRCLSLPAKTIIDQLSPYNTQDVIRRAISQAEQLCPENISTPDWKRLELRLEELAQSGRNQHRHNPWVTHRKYYRRRNPELLIVNPAESTAYLARRALSKLRRIRARAGFDVF